ncbi:hypothetical protein pVa21_117 [Vibrio phage pVa-21]|nr:hypothetical protein pVa21_117 [Vibrio phage pVa-21]
MTFQTTFDLEVFIKACNDLRDGVCDDGNDTLDKWIELGKKHAKDGKLTFTQHLVTNLSRYARAIADTSVRYVFGEDEFPVELQYCLWALDKDWDTGRIGYIESRIEGLRWAEKHMPERFDVELEEYVKGVGHDTRMDYRKEWPDHPVIKKYVLTVKEVLEQRPFDPDDEYCIPTLLSNLDEYGHTRYGNVVATLIYQHLDTLLDNEVAVSNMVVNDNMVKVLHDIFSSPKAYAEYWERLAAYGLKIDDSGDRKIITGYNDWFISLSIKVRGFLALLNDMWDVYLPTKATKARIVSKHYEIVGELPLEGKSYFTDLPLSAVRSLYPDFKVVSFQEFINGDKVKEPLIITYPEERTMASVLLREHQSKLETPKDTGVSVVYVGWPMDFTKGHLNIVEYDGQLEVIEREGRFVARYATMFGTTGVGRDLSTAYLTGSDKTYHAVSEDEVGESDQNTLGMREGLLRSRPVRSLGEVEARHTYGRNARTLAGGDIGRGMTHPRIWNDVLGDLHIARQMGKSGLVSGFFKDVIAERNKDFDGDELHFMLSNDPFPFEMEIKQTPAPVQYPKIPFTLRKPTAERYRLSMGKPVTIGGMECDFVPLMFGGTTHTPLLSTPRMLHAESRNQTMARLMNEQLLSRPRNPLLAAAMDHTVLHTSGISRERQAMVASHIGQEPTVVRNPTELKDVFEGEGPHYVQRLVPDDAESLPAFYHQGTPSRLQMQAGDVDITEAYPKTYTEVNLASDEDKE